MSLYKQLKEQAAAIKGMADLFTKAASVIDQQQQKKASDASTATLATAREQQMKVRIGQMAKQASTLLFNAGVLQTPQQADVVAGLLMSHEQALQKVAQLAKLCERLPRSAAVVTDTRSTEKTANDAWDNAARSVLATLPRG